MAQRARPCGAAREPRFLGGVFQEKGLGAFAFRAPAPNTALPVTASSTAAAAVAAVARFVHLEIASLEGISVEILRRVIGVFHLHESKTPRSPGLAIGDELNGLDFTVLREEVSDLVLRRAEGQVAHIKLLGHLGTRKKLVGSTETDFHEQE